MEFGVDSRRYPDSEDVDEATNILFRGCLDNRHAMGGRPREKTAHSSNTAGQRTVPAIAERHGVRNVS
jgi:hypothetical protein